MKIEDNKILVEQKTGGTPKSGKQGGTPKSGKQGGTNKGGTGNTGGSSGGGNIPAPAPTSTAIPTPSPTPVPEPAPKQTEPVKREQPIEIPQPKKDINFCKCWTIGNLFKEFPDEQKNSKAEDFYTWVSINYNGTFKRTENLVNDKNCGDSNCLFYQSPVIRELSLSQVSTSSLTVAKNLFMVWKETLTPKSVEPKPETQTVAKSPSIGYLTFDDEDAFKTAASQENLYAKNKNGFRTNLDDFINLYKTSTYAESTKRGECRDTARLYISLVNNMIEDSFGDPNSSDLEDYKVRSKYWYGFLTLLMTIKSRLKKCYANKVDFGDLANELSSIPKTDVWGINIVSREPEKFDVKALNTAKQNLPENLTIRKKLIEYKEMKTIKESVKQKLLLKLEDKNKKIDKISENLYKIAGDFYGGNYDKFYNKYNKLVETYKNSKMFLMEDSEQSFSNALVKVFKGDEDKFIGEAIPWFINKLGLEGNVASQVESELRRKYGNESDMSSLFSDDWSDVVVTAVKDNAKSDISEPSSVMDAVEKVMMTNLDSSDFDYKLKREILKMLRPAQDEKKTKIQDLANQIKKSILDQGSES